MTCELPPQGQPRDQGPVIHDGRCLDGSHFTNDDLVKESRMADDYDFSITFEGNREGKEIIEITCVPKESAVVVWARWCSKWNARAMWRCARATSTKTSPGREMTFSGVKAVHDRTLPTVMTIVPSDKPTSPPP